MIDIDKLPTWSKFYPWPTILEFAGAYEIDPVLIAAIIRTESAGAKWATRFEPEFHGFYMPREIAADLCITVATEKVHQATSWGLCQILGATARRLHFSGHMPELCIVENNIYFCCLVLRDIATRYRDTWDQVAAYNAGAAKLTGTGVYRNQVYVDKVQESMAMLLGDGNV